VPAAQAAALTEALLHLDQAKAVQQRAVPGEELVEVTGLRPLLREATLVAIDEAGERLSRLCTSLLRGQGSPAEAMAQVESVRGLLELLGEVSPAPGSLAKRTSVCT
jgi:hypothetical protein